MFGIGKIILGCLLFGVGLVLSFTIIGIIFALPVFTASFGLFAAGLAQLGFKTARAASKLQSK